MVVIPLVFTSVICGVAQIAREEDFGRLGLKTLLLLFPYWHTCCCYRFALCKFTPARVGGSEVKEAIIASQKTSSFGSLEQALNTAENGWLNLIEIFHRMVPPNLFLAATEGRLLGLICFGLLFGFFCGKLKTDLKRLTT